MKYKIKKETSWQILAGVLAAALVLSLLYCNVWSTYEPNVGASEICLTPGCVQAAGEVWRSMDEKVDPCEDFYRFACGNFIRNSVIATDQTYANTFTAINDLLQEQIRVALDEPAAKHESKSIATVKKYYKACKDTSLTEKYGLNIAKELLEKLGGWPVLKKSWSDESFSWLKCTYALQKYGLSTESFLSISVGLDFKHSTKRIIVVDQPRLGISREYLIKGLDDKIVGAYYEYMVEIAVMFGADQKYATEELKKTLDFERKLAEFSLSQEERRNITNLYNIMTISEMQQTFNVIPWHKFINSLLPPKIEINDTERILVGVPKYVGAVQNLIRATPKRVQANYMMWRVVKSIISYLTQTVRDRELAFKHSVTGIQENPPRWKECIDETTNLLPIVVGAIYVRKYFHVDAKRNALEMVKYIKDEFKDMLRSIDWMDKATRRSAIEKANKMVDHIAYPDELLDDKKIGEIFDQIDVDEKQFLYSALNITKFLTENSYSRLVEPVNKTDWREHGFPAVVNAYYHPLENSITFPAGILHGVFFNKDRPRYMNFGAVGSVIGHEITHGFDDTGRQFDKEGNLVNWWKEETKKKFLDRAQCIIRQYNNYFEPEVNMKLNGMRTQGENIADNGGVKQAYLAYTAWEARNRPESRLPGLNYTPRQLFWISAAQVWCSKHRPEALALQVTVDTHSPAEFRVLGPFSNLKYFAKDYNCPTGSKMNPQHKCSIW